MQIQTNDLFSFPLAKEEPSHEYLKYIGGLEPERVLLIASPVDLGFIDADLPSRCAAKCHQHRLVDPERLQREIALLRAHMVFVALVPLESQ